MKLSMYRSIIKTKQDTFLLAGVCLVVFLWFFSYYSQNQDLILRRSFEIKNLETQQKTLAKTKSLQVKLEQTIKELKLKLRNTENNTLVTHPQKPSTYMTEFAHKICKTGLRLDSCIVQKQKNKNWFTQHNIVYEMTGLDEQITKFIQDVRKSNYAIRCTNVALKKIDPQNTHLACTLQFLIFKGKSTYPPQQGIPTSTKNTPTAASA